MSETRFWRLRGPQRWGDYGDVLFGGLFDSPKRTDGRLNILRSGPFVPPISIVEDEVVVVNESFSQLLVAEKLHSNFRPINLVKAVRIRWEKWDQTADLPERPPPAMEPESYLLRGKHSPDVAAQMDALYEVALRMGAESESRGSVFDNQLFVEAATWNGDAIFHVNPVGTFFPIIVTDLVRQLLELHASQWVSFSDVHALE